MRVQADQRAEHSRQEIPGVAQFLGANLEQDWPGTLVGFSAGIPSFVRRGPPARPPSPYAGRVRATAGQGSGCAGRSHPIDQEQDDRTHDRREPGRDVKELVQRVGVENSPSDDPLISAPTMPMMAGNDELPGLSPGSNAFAIAPASSPRMMNAMMPMKPPCFAAELVGAGTPMQRHAGRSRYGHRDPKERQVAAASRSTPGDLRT